MRCVTEKALRTMSLAIKVNGMFPDPGVMSANYLH
jgi:hypothetical protein